LIFVQPQETDVLSIGIQYLWIEGACYFGIGFLFLFYGLYRALRRPGVSVVLTIISLGTRVTLAYILSAIPQIGIVGIWVSVPIGWFLADLVGTFYYHKLKAKHQESQSVLMS
jgi:Na+-driven multidrug efflux pump